MVKRLLYLSLQIQHLSVLLRKKGNLSTRRPGQNEAGSQRASTKRQFQTAEGQYSPPTWLMVQQTKKELSPAEVRAQ